jgi:hypothetical protein
MGLSDIDSACPSDHNAPPQQCGSGGVAQGWLRREACWADSEGRQWRKPICGFVVAATSDRLTVSLWRVQRRTRREA